MEHWKLTTSLGRGTGHPHVLGIVPIQSSIASSLHSPLSSSSHGTPVCVLLHCTVLAGSALLLQLTATAIRTAILAPSLVASLSDGRECTGQLRMATQVGHHFRCVSRPIHHS